MNDISKADAFREFESWSKRALVSLNFGRRDTTFLGFVRRATLEIKGSSLLIEVKGVAMALLNFDSGFTFADLTIEDVKREFAKFGRPVEPNMKSCIGVKNENGDFFFIFEEQGPLPS